MYSPLVTLSLFLEQGLGADHSCQDTVARGLSRRVAQNLPPSVSRTELDPLYGWRWQVDLRAIKTVMQRNVLRCKTPAMLVKEVAAHLRAYNLVRSVMAQAAHQAGCIQAHCVAMRGVGSREGSCRIYPVAWSRARSSDNQAQRILCSLGQCSKHNCKLSATAKWRQIGRAHV